MGTCKLKINVARFAVENSRAGINNVESSRDFGSGGLEDKNRNFNVRDSRSYREVLGKSKDSGETSAASGGNMGGSEKSVVVPDRTAAFNDLVGSALVGRTVDIETLVDFDRLLRIAGTKVSRIQYLVGLSLLISFYDKESAKVFLEDRKIWGPWFMKLEPWNGQSLPLERIVWLKIIGVPLHVLDHGTLDQIGELFGKVLFVPKKLDEDQDLSVSRVGILVGEVPRIQEHIVLRWKNRCFRVWVEEDKDDWTPDCLERTRSITSDDSSPMQSSPVVQMPANDSMENEGSGQVNRHPSGQVSGLHASKEGLGNGISFFEDNNYCDGSNSDVGPQSKVGGDPSKNVFFFKSKKKRSRRCRRRAGGAGTQSSEPVLNFGESLDSIERERPIKRNRAQFSEISEDLFNLRAQVAVNDDLFSIDRLLGQNSVDKATLGGLQSESPADPIIPQSPPGGRRWRGD
ncbi:hypothetical protein Hdeb2414_s0012g00391371 [Helianthus debilis subsp. tardiflorus]